MANPQGKLSSVHKEKIWQLRQKGHTITYVARALADGWPEEAPPIPPVQVSHQAVSGTYRKQLRERDDLYQTSIQTLPTGEAMDVLCRRLLAIADRESQRLADLQVGGKLDARDLERLANAVARIHRLAQIRASEPEPGEPNKPESPPSKPKTFAESLLGDDDGDQPPVADVPVPPTQKPPSRLGEATLTAPEYTA